MAIAGILVYSGLQHMLTQKIYGRVRLDDVPLMEGGVVALIGAAEIIAGVCLFWWWSRRR